MDANLTENRSYCDIIKVDFSGADDRRVMIPSSTMSSCFNLIYEATDILPNKIVDIMKRLDLMSIIVEYYDGSSEKILPLAFSLFISDYEYTEELAVCCPCDSGDAWTETPDVVSLSFVLDDDSSSYYLHDARPFASINRDRREHLKVSGHKAKLLGFEKLVMNEDLENRVYNLLSAFIF